MSGNLEKKRLIDSTVFQLGMIIDLFAAVLYAVDDSFTAKETVEVFIMTFGAYTAKEGVAKSAEAYRDRGAP